MGAIHVVIPIRTVSEANCREHWSRRAKRAASQRSAAALWVRSRLMLDRWPGHRHVVSCRVTMCRVASRRLDEPVNLGSALKAVQDGVADALGTNDGARPGWSWHVTQKLLGSKKEKRFIEPSERTAHVVVDIEWEDEKE